MRPLGEVGMLTRGECGVIGINALLLFLKGMKEMGVGMSGLDLLGGDRVIDNYGMRRELSLFYFSLVYFRPLVFWIP